MSKHLSATDVYSDLALTIRKITILTDVLTEDDGENLTEQAVTDLHFWLSELADEANQQAHDLLTVLNSAAKEAA